MKKLNVTRRAAVGLLALLLVSALLAACARPAPTPAPSPAPPPKPSPAAPKPAPVVSPKPSPAPVASPKPSPAPAAAKVYKLKFGGLYVGGSLAAKTSEEFFMNRAKQLSKDRITWDYYPNNQIASMTEFLWVVQGGSAEAGLIGPAFYTGRIPLIAIQDLPFLFKTDLSGHLRTAIALLSQADFVAAIEKFNIKVLGGESMGTMSLFFKQPLTKLEDFKGRKIRTAGKMQSDGINALGGAAQAIGSPEVYTALQTGVLDGTMWHPNSAVANRIYEVTKYAVIPNISVTGYTHMRVMNADLFKGLPKELQDALIQADKDTRENGLKIYTDDQKVSIEALAKNGMTVFNVPAEENERWRKATRPIWDKWLADNGAVGQRVFDFVLKQLGEK